MSFHNHDTQNYNGMKSERVKKVELTRDERLNGEAIKIYTLASTLPLKEFIKIYKERLNKTYVECESR